MSRLHFTFENVDPKHDQYREGYDTFHATCRAEDYDITGTYTLCVADTVRPALEVTPQVIGEAHNKALLDLLKQVKRARKEIEG